MCGLRPRTAEPPAESPSTMKTSEIVGVVALAVAQLARQAAGLQQALAAGGVAGLAGRHTGGGRLDRLADDVAALAGVRPQPVAQLARSRPAGRSP